MRSRLLLSTALIFMGLLLGGCTISLIQTPTLQPSPYFPTQLPTSTPTTPPPSPTLFVPTLPSPTPTTHPVPTATTGAVILPGSPSGPYAVILVAPGDTLHIRSGPGVGYPVTSSFAATETSVMRTGPSARLGADLWVEVQRTGGGTGWVNAYYLTEYVTPSAFCADGRVSTLLTSLGTALKTSDGALLASLVSPLHGVDVRYWRYGNVINFDAEHARWVFTSTYPHNWGADPAKGEDTIGAFHQVVLPKLLEVYNASYLTECNTILRAGPVIEPWPVTYANINFYSLHKPGTPGVEMDWRTWLVGVEYVQGKFYIFTLIHFRWEP